MEKKTHYVYFLRSLKDDSFYIGTSGNVDKRLREHNNGLSRSTAPKRPWKLERLEKYKDIKSAYKRERVLKKMKSRKLIEKIINSGN
jgi:putative endonuclease